MEYFIEGTYCENSNDTHDIEATLYSMVHHSKEVYNPNIINLTESHETQKSKANRWEAIKNIETSVNPENLISQSGKTRNKTLDHIPISDHNIPSTSTAAYDKQYNRKDQNSNYAWKRYGNKKSWSIKDRIQNDNKLNRNLVPVNVEKKWISPQNSLKISCFESIESDNLQNNICANSKFSREGGKPVNYNMTYNKSLQNNQCNPPVNKNKIMKDMNGGVNQSANFNVHPVADKNVKKSNIISSNVRECIADTVQDTVGFPHISCKKQNTLSKVNGNTNSSLSSENVVEEIVIVSDTDDNCSDRSIVEISVPPKPEPPLVALDSSDETESFNVSNIEPILSVTLESGKPPNFTYESSNSQHTSKKNAKSANDSLLSVSAKSKTIKKKKKDRHVKSIECKTWTYGMVHFYNKSWGGETYDHVKLQREMTSNPTNWKILDIDKYGPMRDYGPLARVRCINCHQFGHMRNQCPDPSKIICCSMCGKQGHRENQCPDKICLKCGRPAPVFNEGCPTCWKHEHPKNCTACGANDHFQWLCPEEWRKFHSTTSVEELQLGTWQEPQLKSPGELACCFCTEKGHTASNCPFFFNQTLPPSNPQPVNIFATLNILNKKRKKKWRSSYDRGCNQYEFNRKRRKTR